jgi:site-specific DNA recombinase
MEVALYARVSTTHQQAQTIDQQLERLRAEVPKHPDWHLANDQTYCDEGYSGAKLNRPGLDRLRDRAALAAFEIVLITTPDRLARKFTHQAILLEELYQRGCRVAFLDRPMSDDPHDQLLLQIRGAVAEYERSLIAERMRRGRQAKYRSGTLLPWTHVPYGYLVDPEYPRDPSRVTIDPLKSEIIKLIFTWYTDHTKPISLYGVANKLSELQIPSPTGLARWSVPTIRGILRSTTYIGIVYCGKKRTVEAKQRRSRVQPIGRGISFQPAPDEDRIAIRVPAIIDQKTSELAQQRLDQNKRFARRNNHSHEYLLRGLVYCGQCRYGCSGRSAKHYSYYICRTRSEAKRLNRNVPCSARYTPAENLDDLVWRDLCHILTNPALITHELTRAQNGDWFPQAVQARRQTLEQAVAQLERQQSRLLEVYLAEVISRDEFERKRQELTQIRNGLRQQLRQLRAQAQRQLNLAVLAEGVESFCRRVQTSLDQLSFAQRRQLVELVIDSVLVINGQVEIRYVIPTSSEGEETPFCHLRKVYFNQVLPGLPWLNRAWFNSQPFKHPHECLGGEDGAVVGNDAPGHSKIAKGCMQELQNG